jgi:hypothetical protein
MHSRTVLVASVVVLLAAVVVTVAWAENNATYYGCVNDSSGTIHMVGSTDKCNNNEVLITWNQIGPPGSPQPATQSPAEAYPAPYPTLSQGGAILAGCPNPAGLQELPGVTEETAVALLTDFRSGDIDRARDVSDPGIWPIIPDLPPSPVQPEVAWLDGSPYPASHSPYAEAIANQCGEPLLKMSWAFTICDPACNVSHSQSLEEEYFVLSRADHLLIWTLWP